MVLNVLVLFLFVTQVNTLINVQFGTMKQGEILRIILDLSLEECWANCENRAACMSISYVRKMKLCYLYSVKKSSEDTTVIDVVSREKPKQVSDLVCGTDKCYAGEVCDTVSKTCKVQECASINLSYGVDTFGNMAFIGSKKLQKCKFGFITTKEHMLSRESVLCTNDGWQNQQLDCVSLNCKTLADIGRTSSRTYYSYNEGIQNVIKIFCEFNRGQNSGFSFLSADTLHMSVKINAYYNRKDHVMLRHLRNGVQYESRIEVLPHGRGRYNISVFNSENPDFSGHIFTKPYLFIGFIPISFGNHYSHIKGYTCHGQNYSFKNCDDNRNNYFAIYESNNTDMKCYSGTVKDGWKFCSRAIASSRNIPAEAFFNSYEIGMGGCGCFVRSCDTDVHGFAFGLPFEY